MFTYLTCFYRMIDDYALYERDDFFQVICRIYNFFFPGGRWGRIVPSVHQLTRSLPIGSCPVYRMMMMMTIR